MRSCGVNPQLDTCGSFDFGGLCESKMFELLDHMLLQTLVGHTPFDFAGEATIVDLYLSPLVRSRSASA